MVTCTGEREIGAVSVRLPDNPGVLARKWHLPFVYHNSHKRLQQLWNVLSQIKKAEML